MNGYGMFKAVICDEGNEYTFPFYPGPEKIVRWILILVFIFSLFVFSIFTPVLTDMFIRPVETNNIIKDQIDGYGMTKLHRAVIKGNLNVLKILIRNGLDINKTDDYGWTPLHWAKFLSREDFIAILIANGAREDLKSTRDWFIYKKGSLANDIN